MAGDEIRLVIKRHGMILDERLVDQEELSAGRDPDCDLVLDDPSTSRRVAIFRRQGAELWVEDTGSLEGVRVNGETVESVALCNGDHVDVGPFTIEIEGGSLPARSVPASETVQAASQPGPVISMAPEAEPAVELTLADGRTTGLPEGRFVLGRDSGCHVVLGAGAVSKRHAEIEVGPSDVKIRDLGSTNGTTVNGRRIDEQTLADGDRIQCGDEPISIEFVAPGLTSASVTTTPSGAMETVVQPGAGETILTGADLLEQQARVGPAAAPAPVTRTGKGRLLLRVLLVVLLTVVIGVFAMVIMAPEPRPAPPPAPATAPEPVAEPEVPALSAADLYRAGVRELQQDRIQAAVDLWEQSLALDPQVPEVVDAYGALLYRVGYVYEGDGQLDKARQTWERLVDKLAAHPENQYVIRARVRLRRLEGD